MIFSGTVLIGLLGRLFDRVDLIKPVSNVPLSSVCAYLHTYVRNMYVCPYVHPQKVSLISMKFGVYVEVSE